jgi:hypothetical protein
VTDTIERVAGLSITELREQYLDKNIPVVVTGHVSQWPAASTWTPEFMADTVGHKTVPVVSMHDGDYAHADRKNMPLKQYLEMIGAIESADGDVRRPHPDETHYLAQVSLANFLPELLEDVEEPPFFPDETFSSSVIYIGGTLFSQLHYHPRGSATLCLL